MQMQMKNVNQPRLPVQQLGLLQLSSLGRDLHKGGTGAALLRPTVAKLAVRNNHTHTQLPPLEFNNNNNKKLFMHTHIVIIVISIHKYLSFYFNKCILH
jgi:hypothetical protein